MKISRKFSLSRTISVILISLLIGGFIAVYGGEQFFILPVLLMTVGFTFCLLLGTFGRDFLKFIPDSILTLFSTPSEPIPRYADIARYASRYIVAGAAIASLIVFIQMLREMSDPKSISHGMVASLLPLLYALVFSEVVFALLYKIYSDGNAPRDTPPLAAKTLAIIFILCGVLFSTFIIMFFFTNRVLTGSDQGNHLHYNAIPHNRAHYMGLKPLFSYEKCMFKN